MAKRLSATPLSKETRIDTSEPSRGAILVPVARIGSPLLLKTNLPRSPGATQAATGRIHFSIAGRNVPGNDSTSKPGVPLLAPSVCRLNPDMPRGLAPEHTKPIGWAGSVSVVGRVDRLLAGKDAGLVQSRCLRAAHLGSAPAPPQLLSSSAVQGMGSGKVATSRSITSTRCRMVSVGSLGRRGRFSRR